MVMTDLLVVENGIVERVLNAHRIALGSDFEGYRNHIYRVASFFNQLGPASFESTPALAVAAAFHDLGIWVHNTFDYLAPSSRLAANFLEAEGLAGIDPALVHELIVQHHKVRRYKSGPCAALVDQWRKADLVDVSLGLFCFNIPRSQVRQIQQCLPDKGFHKGLLKLTLRQLARAPWDPLPMMKW